MATSLRKIIGRNIRNRRQELGLSQEELGYKCDTHTNYISKVELAQISIGVERLERIAKALKVPAYQLLMTEEQH